MKVYRLIPDSFTICKNCVITGLSENETICTEDIYYNMGYLTLSDKKYLYSNTAIKMLFDAKNGDLDKMGKYFYIFPEDAVIYGRYLLTGFNKFHVEGDRLVEYDIPDELIMKYYGYGTYEGDDDAAECYITEDNFEGEVISSNEVSIEDKRKSLIKTLKQTLNSLIEFKDKDYFYYSDDWETYIYFSDFFNVKELSEIINDDGKLEEKLFNSAFYESFVKKEIAMVKTSYITNKSLSLPLNATHYPFGHSHEDYFKEKGFNVDFGDKHYYFRREMTNYVSSSMDEKEKKEVIKELRKQKGA